MRCLPTESLRDTLTSTLLSVKPGEGIKLLEADGSLACILPEVQACVGFDQRSVHHDKSVFEHLVDAVDWTPPRLRVRLAALLHDVGKPASFSIDEDGEGHFYSHHLVGEILARKALERLAFDPDTVEAVCVLVREHMSRYDFLRVRTIKRFIMRVGIDNLQDLFDLQIADIRASKPPHKYSRLFALREGVLHELRGSEPLPFGSGSGAPSREGLIGAKEILYPPVGELTPGGGVFAEAYYFDEQKRPTPKDRATRVIIRELDSAGERLRETLGRKSASE